MTSAMPAIPILLALILVLTSATSSLHFRLLHHRSPSNTASGLAHATTLEVAHVLLTFLQLVLLVPGSTPSPAVLAPVFAVLVIDKFDAYVNSDFREVRPNGKNVMILEAMVFRIVPHPACPVTSIGLGVTIPEPAPFPPLPPGWIEKKKPSRVYELPASSGMNISDEENAVLNDSGVFGATVPSDPSSESAAAETPPRKAADEHSQAQTSSPPQSRQQNGEVDAVTPSTSTPERKASSSTERHLATPGSTPRSETLAERAVASFTANAELEAAEQERLRNESLEREMEAAGIQRDSVLSRARKFESGVALSMP